MATVEVRKQDLASEIAAIVGSSNMDASRVNGKTADASETAVIQCGALRCGAMAMRRTRSSVVGQPTTTQLHDMI
ncbi:hypothetical protein CFAM422_007272 [Trichoderma lentiforme]|uniref:Uncharacterized protein n=1 Tax=Trichoderma lentiforme TaxID=1567552 RepID=A0A9P5CAY5_9HYPO|nr:hypothetical protein CFAM422_007272 [Trichoderma lentiforme]